MTAAEFDQAVEDWESRNLVAGGYVQPLLGRGGRDAAPTGHITVVKHVDADKIADLKSENDDLDDSLRKAGKLIDDLTAQVSAYRCESKARGERVEELEYELDQARDEISVLTDERDEARLEVEQLRGAK